MEVSYDKLARNRDGGLAEVFSRYKDRRSGGDSVEAVDCMSGGHCSYSLSLVGLEQFAVGV